MQRAFSVNDLHRGFRGLYIAFVVAGLFWRLWQRDHFDYSLHPLEFALGVVAVVVGALTQIGTSTGRPTRTGEITLTIISDMALLTALVHTVHASTVLVFVSMIWVMLRAALRYGVRFLIAGMALSIAGLGSAMFSGGVWSDYPHIGWGLLAGLVLMPTYIFLMVRHLMKARDRAHQADLAKSRFLANMSHEFRTPLNGILGLADLLTTVELPDEARRYVDGIRASAAGLGKSVQELLDFASIEAGRVRVTPEDFAVAEIVQSVLVSVQPQVMAKGLEIRTSIAPNVPEHVNGDSEHARRTLLSIVCNAVKFTQKGHIDISVEWRHRGDEKAMLVFRIADTGPGFSPEIGQRIFDPFEQADSSLSRTAGGTGLGLAIAKGFVEANNGDIGFKSTPGEGSLFWFTFEVRPVSGPADVNETSAAAAPPARPMRILIVDDQPSNRMVFEPMLRKAGHQVVSRDSGAAAIDYLSREWSDLLLIDLHMPGLNGVDVVAWVRAREAARNLPPMPVLVLTADGTDHARTVAMAAGATGLVTKPISMADLYRQVNALASRAESGSVQAATVQSASGCFLTDLRETLGDEAAFQGIVAQSIEDLGRELESLRSDIAYGRIGAAAQGAHTVKGLAHNLGLELLAGTAKSLEDGMRDKQLGFGDCLMILDRMEQLFRDGTRIVRARFVERSDAVAVQ